MSNRIQINYWFQDRMNGPFRKFFFLITASLFFNWGFFGHETVNRLAVYSLPMEMIVFYKNNQPYLIESSANPDKRRYAVSDEAPRHYIDLDTYGDTVSMPVYWNAAVERWGTDTLMERGVVPWHIYRTFLQLRDAYVIRDPSQILRLSSELGHYVADAHVPLHTSSNHNGQKSNQHGIHGFWESRLPELFYDRYDLYTGPARYIEDVQREAWKVVMESHRAVDSVLTFEKNINDTHSDRKYSFETKGTQTVKVYSVRYSTRYHEMLNGMVERRLRSSIHMVGSLWYTAWVDAGQPDLTSLINYKPSEEELAMRKLDLARWKEMHYQVRSHED